MPVSWLPTTMPVPLKPSDQTFGALTWFTPGSTTLGSDGPRASIIETESKEYSAIAAWSPASQFDASFDSMRLTSDRAASVLTRLRSTPFAAMAFATQNALYDTPWASNSLRSGPWVLSASRLSVR